MPRSALIVAVSTPPLVQRLRSELASDAVFGVPPHITVLFPFVPPNDITQDVLDRVARVASSLTAPHYVLSETGWFAREVLWLAPAAPQPFREFTAAFVDAFPGYPPYAGQHGEVLPHLTIGDSGDVEKLRDAEKDVRSVLPLTGIADAISLIQESSTGYWGTTHSFPLAVS